MRCGLLAPRLSPLRSGGEPRGRTACGRRACIGVRSSVRPDDGGRDLASEALEHRVGDGVPGNVVVRSNHPDVDRALTCPTSTKISTAVIIELITMQRKEYRRW